MARTKTPKLKCPQCGQTFSLPMHLGRHMKTKHGQGAGRPAAGRRAARVAAPARTATGTVAEQLGSLIERLQTERQEHFAALGEIDAVLARFGIQPQAASRRGRPPKAQPAGRMIGAPAAYAAGRRRRRKFATPATDSILQFVRSGGTGGRTSSDIAKHWKEEGRAGQPFVTLGQLTKTRKLKKEDIKGQRGSRYTVV